MTAKMLNLGSGRTKFPGPRPDHHLLAPETLYQYPEWLNISKNASEEPDCVMDLFAYPWPLESDAYAGALCAHLCEHIPHEIKGIRYRDDGKPDWRELANLQDGWYAFFSELYRVLQPGAMVHIIAPHAWSTGAIHDPSHTRYLLPETFNHSMKPDPDAPFSYETGNIHFETREVRPGVSSYFAHLVPTPLDPPAVAEAKVKELEHAAATRMNVVSEFYVRLECVK